MRLVSPPIRALPCATAIALAAALATAPGCSRPEEPAAPAIQRVNRDSYRHNP